MSTLHKGQRVELLAADGTSRVLQLGRVIDPEEQDGRVFVGLEDGCSGNFPAHRIRPAGGSTLQP